MQEHIDKARKLAHEQFKKLSNREKSIVAGAALVLCGLIFFQIIDSTMTAFDNQSTRLQKIEEDMKSIAQVLQSYTKAKTRREAIEKIYKEVEIKEGALSHLETLVKDKALIPPGQFTIVERPPKKYGESYEQVGFALKFSSTNLNTLIDFLRELVHGQKPLVLADMTLSKNRVNQALEVELSVSSMREISKEETSEVKLESSTEGI